MPSVDGIVSGLNTTSLIDAIVTAQRVTVNVMEAHQEEFELQREAVAGVKNRLVELTDAIGQMGTAEEFVAYSVAGNSAQYTLTAGAGATPGSYSIQVERLATAQSTSSQGFNDPNASVLGTGTVTLTTAQGVQTDVTVDASNNSLTGLAAELNEIDGISAYVLDTGAAIDRYRLIVQGEGTGAQNAFTLDTSALAGGTALTLNNDIAAVDAQLKIGGVTVLSGSNTLTDVVPGLTIELHAAGASADTATVALDTDETRAKLEAVIEAYNSALGYYAQMSVYNTTEDIRGPLFGESTTRRAIEDLGGMIANAYPVPGTDLRSLAELGVSTGRDGTLTLDTAAFNKAFEADPDSVTALLTDKTGPLAQISTRIEELYVDAETGSLIARDESLQSMIEDLDEQIATAELRIEDQAQRLRDQFNAMEMLLGQIQSTQSYLASFFATPAPE